MRKKADYAPAKTKPISVAWRAIGVTQRLGPGTMGSVPGAEMHEWL